MALVLGISGMDTLARCMARAGASRVVVDGGAQVKKSFQKKS